MRICLKAISKIYGDLWPNAVFLIENDPSSVKVVILDWEFARISHYYNDFFQFLGYLLLMECDAKYNEDHIRYLRESLLKLLDKSKITDENLAVALVNAVLVIHENRWNFTCSKQDLCSRISNWICTKKIKV
jgi:hypothetical protein